MKKYEINMQLRNAIVNLLQDCFLLNRTVREINGVISLLMQLQEIKNDENNKEIKK